MAQEHFGLSPVWACVEFLFGVSFCIFASRLMGRRGWSAMPIPDGWVEVIRGPRPKAENWPRSKPNVVVQKGAQGRQLAKSFGMRPFQDPSVNTAAKECLSKLEAALGWTDQRWSPFEWPTKEHKRESPLKHK